MTGGSMSLSDNITVNNLISNGISVSNLVNTNVLANVAVVTSTSNAMGNSNTVGTIITTGGNVGINTTNPDYGSFGATEKILGITGVATNRARLSFQNTATGTTGVSGTIAFFNSTTQLAALDVIADGATNSGRYAFNTNNAGTFAERMRITCDGTVLIGRTTTTPNGGELQLSGGITFPATQVAKSDANTLDDYEEGTWTPNQGAGLTVVGAFASSAVYTKVGRLVTVSAKFSGATSIAVTAGGILCTNLPFTVGTLTGMGSIANGNPNQFSCVFVNTGSTNAFASGAITASFDIFFTVTYTV
jgi:hypothetical protein